MLYTHRDTKHTHAHTEKYKRHAYKQTHMVFVYIYAMDICVCVCIHAQMWVHFFVYLNGVLYITWHWGWGQWTILDIGYHFPVWDRVFIFYCFPSAYTVLAYPRALGILLSLIKYRCSLLWLAFVDLKDLNSGCHSCTASTFIHWVISTHKSLKAFEIILKSDQWEKTIENYSYLEVLR